MSDRFHTTSPGRPVIIDGRYYVGDRASRFILRSQPRNGFTSVADAEAWLAGRMWGCLEKVGDYRVVEAGMIDMTNQQKEGRPVT